MDVIRKHNIAVQKNGRAEFYAPTSPSEEAKICLECPLPAKSCKPSTCKRYTEEVKQLREKRECGGK